MTLILIVAAFVAGGGAACVGSARARKGQRITWYVWLLAALGLVSVLLGCDTLIGSLAEEEAKAAYMGFGLFAIIGLLLGAVAWRLDAASLKKTQRSALAKSA